MRLIVLGDRQDFLTHDEIDASLALLPEDVEARWVPTADPRARDISEVDAVWLAPGTPYQDVANVFAAIASCRIEGRPILGTCGGFQYIAVELARSLAGIEDAAHSESSGDAATLVISPLACSLYGEIRTILPRPGTLLASICGSNCFDGFHYCGYGLNPAVRPALEEAGVVFSATAPDAGIEALELPSHPFFVATAFQPQVGATATQAVHPLVSALCEAGRTFHETRRQRRGRQAESPFGLANSANPGACEMA